jgi:hypothetical protein
VVASAIFRISFAQNYCSGGFAARRAAFPVVGLIQGGTIFLGPLARENDRIELGAEAQPGLTSPQLAEKMDIEPDKLSRVLPALVSEGKLRRVDQGWYRISTREVAEKRIDEIEVRIFLLEKELENLRKEAVMLVLEQYTTCAACGEIFVDDDDKIVGSIFTPAGRVTDRAPPAWRRGRSPPFRDPSRPPGGR